MIELQFLNYLIDNHKYFIFSNVVISISFYPHYFFPEMCESITIIEVGGTD